MILIIDLIIVYIGSANLSLDFWKLAKPLKEYEQIVSLYDSDDIVLGSGDFMIDHDDKPNLKIQFTVYESLQLEYLYKKLSYAQNSSTYKIFGTYLSNESVNKVLNLFIYFV